MIHRIMLAAALLTGPAIVVAEQPVRAVQQADTAKAKPKMAKKSMHKKAGKTAAPKAAPKDSGMAK